MTPSGLGPRWLALAPNLRGALGVVGAGVCFSAMALAVKLLGARLDSFQIAFFRASFGLIGILPFALRAGPGAMRTTRPGLHVARGVLGAGVMFCGYYALTHLPLADAVAISYARPLFLIVLAVLFLGERVHLRRWTATAVGFLGVLVMMRPAGGIEFASLVALAGTLIIAVVNVLVKKLAATDSPVTILLYFGIVSTIATALPALAVWRAPTAPELMLLVFVGAAGVSAQTCMIRGLRLGEATAVIPFDYFRLLIAGALGFLVFAETPDRWTLIGAVVIVAATLYIALREARLGKPAQGAVAEGDGAPGPG